MYVNWLSGAERLLSVLSVPSAGVGMPPGLGSFSSLPVVSPSEPEVSSPLVSLPPEPEPPLSEPEPPEEPEVSPVWSFSVDWVSFSSLPPSEESLPLVSPG